MPFLDRGKFRLHYEVHEGLVERDTLCLHGNLASNSWWEPAIDLWRAESTEKKKAGRLICAEWRGCGRSNTGLTHKTDLTLPELAADQNELLRHLQAKDSRLIGHSTGGLIGLYALASAPDLYSRALLLDPVGATGVQFGPEMHAAFTQMSQNKEFCAAVILGTIHQASLAPSFQEKIVSDAYSVHPLVWHGVPEALQAIDFRPSLPQIQQPVLVLHGEHDLLLEKKGSEDLASALPQGRFLELAGRGHSCNVEDPALFVRTAQAFLYG